MINKDCIIGIVAGEYVREEWVCVYISGYVLVPVLRWLCAGFSCNDYCCDCRQMVLIL